MLLRMPEVGRHKAGSEAISLCEAYAYVRSPLASLIYYMRPPSAMKRSASSNRRTQLLLPAKHRQAVLREERPRQGKSGHHRHGALPGGSCRRHGRYLAALSVSSRRRYRQCRGRHSDPLPDRGFGLRRKFISRPSIPGWKIASPASRRCTRLRMASQARAGRSSAALFFRASQETQWPAGRCGLSLETSSEAPAGAGISGSSALMIATTAALARYTGRALTLEQIREIAQNVEAQLIQGSHRLPGLLSGAIRRGERDSSRSGRTPSRGNRGFARRVGGARRAGLHRRAAPVGDQ